MLLDPRLVGSSFCCIHAGEKNVRARSISHRVRHTISLSSWKLLGNKIRSHRYHHHSCLRCLPFLGEGSYRVLRFSARTLMRMGIAMHRRVQSKRGRFARFLPLALSLRCTCWCRRGCEIFGIMTPRKFLLGLELRVLVRSHLERCFGTGLETVWRRRHWRYCRGWALDSDAS